ncbi:delta-60 repeat domain-containing protein [Flavobacterium sp.]|uniref:delta-60 repeat domain-containing protein n=1 Tax=Flavobacterium sp. TaxID=239 RepID=UPI003A8DFF89
MYKILSALLLFSSSVFSQSLTIDDSFDQGTGLPVGSIIKNVTEFTNNRILLMGHMNMYNGVAVGNISLINSDGSVDYNFNCGSCFNNEITTAVAQGDKLVIGGAFTEFNGVPRKFFARLNEDGSLDSSFDASASFDEAVDATMYISQISSFGNYPFQQLYVSGGFSIDGMPYVNPIIRLNFDGSLDTTFNFQINFIAPYIESFAVLDNGKILVGTFSDGLFRINSDGSLDESFNTFDTYHCVINSIHVLDNGKILLGGHFFDNDSQTRSLLVRLNEDGSVDDLYDSFEVNFNGINSEIYSITKFNDKIICTGKFSSYNGFDDFFVLNEDGSFDDSFNIGGVTSEFYAENNYISQAVVLNNSKIMIYGRFDKVGESPIVNLARLGYDDLNANDYDKSNDLTIYSQNETTYFSSVNNSISSIEFYDISGRLIDSAIVNSDVYSCTLPNNSLILYRIFLNDGAIVTGKVIR